MTVDWLRYQILIFFLYEEKNYYFVSLNAQHFSFVIYYYFLSYLRFSATIKILNIK